MASFIFIDEHGNASCIFCEACPFNIGDIEFGNFVTSPIAHNAKQLHEIGWEKLREINGYICPSCAKKDYLRRMVST